MNRNIFFAELRKHESEIFGTSLSQGQMAGIAGILDAFETHGDGRKKTLAYALGTSYHETGGSMLPVKETVYSWHKNKNPSDAEVIRRLDRAWAKGQLGQVSKPYWQVNPKYGKAFFGRGQVQITHDYNYRASSADAGVDLLKNPDAMLDPKISAKVLVRGLMDGRWNGDGHGIAIYLANDDLKNARRTVNGTDRWQDVGDAYTAFLSAIHAAGGVSAAIPIDATFHEPAAAPVASDWIAALVSAILRMFGAIK